jgi:hypothetical protein
MQNAFVALFVLIGFVGGYIGNRLYSRKLRYRTKR